MIGGGNTTTLIASISIKDGVPVHISHMTIGGKVNIEDGGELELTACTLEDVMNGGTSGSGRAVSVVGGTAILKQVMIVRCAAGAISVHSASLVIIESIIQECSAQHGGAVLVGKDAVVQMERSKLISNNATLSGGAILVSEGANVTVDSCLLQNNMAGQSGGALQVIRSLRTAVPACDLPPIPLSLSDPIVRSMVTVVCIYSTRLFWTRTAHQQVLPFTSRLVPRSSTHSLRLRRIGLASNRAGSSN